MAIDRTSKFAYAELYAKATRMKARDFLTNLLAAVPYVIHTILTDNGIQFAKREGTETYWVIPFHRICTALAIENWLSRRSALNKTLVKDITYIAIGEGLLYLDRIKGLFIGELVCHALDACMA